MQFKTELQAGAATRSGDQRGLNIEGKDLPEMLMLTRGEAVAQLKAIGNDCLEKAGLSAVNEKLYEYSSDKN